MKNKTEIYPALTLNEYQPKGMIAAGCECEDGSGHGTMYAHDTNELLDLWFDHLNEFH